MLTIHIFITLCLFLTQNQAKIYHVASVITPGARYHLNDLYDGSMTYSKWGELTPIGLRQQQNLGKSFKQEYKDTISETFNKDQIQLWSLNLNRSIQSGLANLYGMYPLGNGQLINKADKQYHIPPYSYSDDIDESTYALPEGQLIFQPKRTTQFLQECPNQP